MADDLNVRCVGSPSEWILCLVKSSGQCSFRTAGEVVSEIRQIHSEDHKDVYGSPRMHQELVARGYEICETTLRK